MQGVAKLATEESRRSGRIPKEVAIRLIGWDADGKEFVEQTKTVLLSRHGAGIVSTYKLAAEQEMILVHLERNKESEIRVVGQIGSEGGSYTYGVAFLDPNVDFWGVPFPSAKDGEVLEHGMVLQCGVCGHSEFMNTGALESDIYAIHDGILRDCNQCHRSTFWRQTTDKVSDDPALPQAEPVPPDPVSCEAVSHEVVSPEPVATLAPCSTPQPFKNTRAHARIRVNFTACVRDPGSGDCIVLCENISRGGLCFKSRRRYFQTAQIEVAAPYSPGSPCILVPARIVYVQEIPEEGMFRCGFNISI